jgi:hypothetical protein
MWFCFFSVRLTFFCAREVREKGEGARERERERERERKRKRERKRERKTGINTQGKMKRRWTKTN